MPDTGMPTAFLFMVFSIALLSAHRTSFITSGLSVAKGLPNDFGTLHVKVHFYSFISGSPNINIIRFPLAGIDYRQ